MNPLVKLLAATATAALAVLFFGCGPGTPQFDPATKYTPESLAQELVFRYKDLSPDARVSTRKYRAVKIVNKDKDAEKTGYVGDSTKKAPVSDLDGLVDDMAVKTQLIKGMSRPQVVQAMIATIAADQTLKDSEKEVLKIKLQEVAGSG